MTPARSEDITTSAPGVSEASCRPEALEALWSWLKEQTHGACDIDGGDLQEKAIELGLWVIEPYDPAVHGDDDYAEEGDPICVDRYARAKRAALPQVSPSASESSSGEVQKEKK